MKFRLLSLSLILFAAVSLTSCVRSYTCQCNIKYSGQPGLPDSVVREYPIRDTKKKAEQLCKDNSETSTNGGIKTVEECDLF